MALPSIGYINKKVDCTFNYEWVIDDFNIYGYNIKDKNDYIIHSPPFILDLNKNLWRMKLKFCRTSDFQKLYLKLFIELICSNNKDKFLNNKRLEIKIGNHGPYTMIPRFFKCGYEVQYQVNNIIVVEELFRDASEDTLRISCVSTEYYEEMHCYPVDSPDPSECINADLKNSFNTRKNSDVTFIVDDQQIKAHKFILQCRSIVFEKMFDHEMLEKRTNQIEILDAKPEIFEKMLEFIYTDNVEGQLTVEDGSDLLDLAEKYQLKNLKILCGKSLYNSILKINALDIHLIAKRYAIEELLTSVKEYIKRYKSEVMKAKKSEYFLKNPEALELLLELT